MKALTLQCVTQGDQQGMKSGRSLSSNYAPPNLENKLLSQSCTLTHISPLLGSVAQPPSCPSLQPSRFSSTVSSLLSGSSCSPSPISALLRTDNNLLTSSLPLFSSLSGATNNSLLSTSLVSSSTLLKTTCEPSSSSLCNLGGSHERCDDEDDSKVMEISFGEMSVTHSEEDDFPEEEVEEGAEPALEQPALRADLSLTELELPLRQEEFAELDREDDTLEKKRIETKYLLLNEVCCSLVNKSTPPGQEDWNSADSVWTRIMNLAKDISLSDPQFLLKVAVYTRQELNIRITANFLLALAANQPSTKSHFRRYFRAAVQLPSDWLEIVRIYSTCFSRSLPMCLKKAMTEKFKDFSEYQLAKYNTRKHRCKHNSKTSKSKKPEPEEIKNWSNLLRSDPTFLEKFLKNEDKKRVVDKKQSEFSMKTMIKKLHIKEPAEQVMAILGKRYPSDIKQFTHSGIKGTWEPDRSGQRMKLKEPQTWEHLLSQEGNKASTWEKLIDSKSLPFMAMLRNLRNIITRGVSEDHHNKILSKLTNKKAVIQSRQFPFRFLTAYKVILELYSLASVSEKKLPSVKDILKDILKKIPKSKRFKKQEWDQTPRTRIRATLGVPFIYRLYQMKKNQFLKANQRLYSTDLLERYRTALERAVQISCQYNVPPLPGRTVIAFSFDLEECRSMKQDFCLPPDPDKDNDGEMEEEDNMDDDRRRRNKNKDELSPTMTEVAVLLGLMIGSRAEDFELFKSNWNSSRKLQLKSDVLLENVRSVVKQMQESVESEQDALVSVLTKKNKVDNIIVLCDNWLSHNLEWNLTNYRKNINEKAMVIKIHLNSQGYRHQEAMESNCVTLKGFSDQLLRFVAERGSSRLLDHVEHLDKVYNIPPVEGAKRPQVINSVVPIPAVVELRWRVVRVFISSTFRDMHAERDVLVQSVFPELRRRAASHCLYLQEVELRWGVTEEESGRAAELCLGEVCRSQMLVGILGERYGLVPPKPVLPDLPEYKWLASAPTGLSITEMEMCQFKALFPGTAPKRMFCYFRDPKVIKSIPVAWRSDFVAESKEAESRMVSLKNWLQFSEVKITKNYPSEWGGVVDGKPYLKNLEMFGRAVLEDLWTAVVQQFVEEEDVKASAESNVSEQKVHQGALQRQFYGRAKLLAKAVEMVDLTQSKGGMMVVEGAAGEGKSVFMAALADALRNRKKSRENLDSAVISYSASASQSARFVENLLQFLIQWLREIKETEERPISHSYKDLLSEFHSVLTEENISKPLLILIDGVDLITDGKACDWIPLQIPKGVCLVISLTSKTALLQTLAKKRGALLFTLGPLTVPERREIVEKGLDTFGKKLSDTAFNNQLQTLIMKRGAVSPLYLHLACEDLRNFASFDKLKENLQGLPQSLSQLVEYSLDRLCSKHRGSLGLRWALAALTVSPIGLREGHLYSVLNTCSGLLSQGGPASWPETLRLSRKPKERIPMTTFTHIVHSLKSLIGPFHCHNNDDMLTISNPEVRKAFENFLLPSEVDRRKAHLVLAAHLWVLADQEDKDAFHHCEANSVKHLPSSLIDSGQVEVLHCLLSSFHFLYANVRHGLLQHLMEIYSLFYDKYMPKLPLSRSCVEDCWGFLQRHCNLLSNWPNLCIQQALNEPPGTPANSWAQSLVGKGDIGVVEWLNKDQQQETSYSKLLSTFSSAPACVVVSSDGRLVVVGTGQGMLHVLSTLSGQEVKSLVSSCDGISSCVFLKDGSLATTSFDGFIEVWDLETGCRTHMIDGHTNAITANDLTADMKHLATVSLDSTLKVWSPIKGQEIVSFPSPGPLNCVTFDPDDHLLAAGCWNGNVIVWNWLQNKIQTSLCGHKRSVRSLCFSSSSMLCSGSVSGEIRVWSVSSSTCVGCFQAHSGATEALTFLDEGKMLLSAGSDRTLQLWSGGLGHSFKAFKADKCEQEPPLKKSKLSTSEPAALCVALHGDLVAVGYHGDGIKLFNLDTAEKIWTPDHLDVSVLCLKWVTLNPEKPDEKVLMSSGSDKRVRVWKRKKGEEGLLGAMEMIGLFAGQPGVILAMEQNSTHLATASESHSIAVWQLSEMAEDICSEPHDLLRGHSGGVTCLAFSPEGGRLLSGGKDKALMLWDLSVSPAVLSKSLPHCHRDWITGCVWTPDCVISSSDDGRWCLWDVEAGQRLKEVSWKSPLTSVCCLDQYVIAGCAEGGLHVWMWETSTEICHIAAHNRRIHHCSVLPNPDNADELTVFTASDDGTVQLWKPLEVENLDTFQGHGGAISGLVCREGVPEFLTVSEDRSLRCWTWKTEGPRAQRSEVSALCFSPLGDVLLAGYESGLMEIWQHHSVVGHKQTSDCGIAAICSMPDNRFAVSYMKPVVDVFKLVWNQQRNSASLVKLNTYKLKYIMARLIYCSVLIGATDFHQVMTVIQEEGDEWGYVVSSWNQSVHILELMPNDEKSLWLIGRDNNDNVQIGFIFTMGPNRPFNTSFGCLTLNADNEEKKKKTITASTMNKDLVVCGDVHGDMWFIHTADSTTWNNRKHAHNDRISVLRLTEHTVISASHDRTVKLWDRKTKKQVGMFVCGGPVVHVAVNPQKSSELVCADGEGKLYFLSWKEKNESNTQR